SEAPWADSHVPTEATASAATTAWTGVRCVDDRGNGEEQDGRGGNTSDQASLGGNGRFECRCARRRQERLHAEMAHGPPQAQRLVSQRKPQRRLRQKEGKRSVVCWRRPLSWCSMIWASGRGSGLTKRRRCPARDLGFGYHLIRSPRRRGQAE